MSRADTTDAPRRRRLTTIARENRALFTDHPWVAEVSTLRPALGPGALAKYEHELGALDGLGLTAVEIDDCLSYLLSFVQANARDADRARTIARETATDDQGWWDLVQPELARFLQPEQYPLATRIGTAAATAHASAHDPEHAYQFGLRRVLDGLAALIDERRGASTPRPVATAERAARPQPRTERTQTARSPRLLSCSAARRPGR